MTLASLAKVGFNAPRLFVDGDQDASSWGHEFALPVSVRWPRVRTAGNWMLALLELFVREPTADRYAIFQDDLLACKGLKAYLEAVPYPDRGYLNLYTFPQNEIPDVRPLGKEGWWPSNQRGRGAVGLVFDKSAAIALMASTHYVERPLSVKRGWKNIDGGVVTALGKAGWREWCHSPSLVGHTGEESTTRPGKAIPEGWAAASWRGEEWDAMGMVGRG